MSDLSGPSRTGYLSTASSRYLGAAPAEHNFGDYFAGDLGKSLAAIGTSEFLPKRTDIGSLKTQQEIDAANRKAKALNDIGDLVSQMEPGAHNATNLYMQALSIGTKANLTPDEIDRVFQGGALASGGDENTVGRIGNRGSYSPNTFFTPEGAAGRRTEERGFTLADHAAAIAEEQRKEGVSAGAATTLAGRQQAENIRQEGVRAAEAQRKEGVDFQHQQDLEKFKHTLTDPKMLPPGAVDDVNKEISHQLHDRLGMPEYGANDKATDVPLDPGIQTKISARAAELMAAPSHMDPIAAVAKATDELVKLEPKADLGGEIFGGFFGKNVGPKVTTLKKDDPFGLR